MYYFISQNPLSNGKKITPHLSSISCALIFHFLNSHYVEITSISKVNIFCHFDRSGEKDQNKCCQMADLLFYRYLTDVTHSKFEL
jgi:hypothetical protein